MPVIPHAQILRIHRAAVALGLTASRDELLAGIPQSLTTAFPAATNASEQILSDLERLNEFDWRPDQSLPLETWISNAWWLAQWRPEADVFRGILASLRTPEELKGQFDKLVRENLRVFVRRARQIVGAADAEDVVMNALYRLWMEPVFPIVPMRRRANELVHYEAKHWLRSRSRQSRESPSGLRLYTLGAAANDTPESAIREREYVQSVHKLLGSLSREDSDLLLLLHEGFSPREVASTYPEYGSSEDVVRKARRARARLRKNAKARATETETAPRTTGPKPPRGRPRGPRLRVYHPTKCVPKRWFTVLVYIYQPSAGNNVDSDARAKLERQPLRYKSNDFGGFLDVSRGANIRVVSELHKVKSDPSEIVIRYDEDVHRCEFQIRTDSAKAGDVSRGRIACYVGPVLVGEISVRIAIYPEEDAAIRERRAYCERRGALYRSVYVSYDAADERIVHALKQTYLALGLGYLPSMGIRRDGAAWEPAALRLIDEADVFQLCWSRAAKRSRHVSKEWRHAIQLERENFVRACYWEVPKPAPPPQLKNVPFVRLKLDALLGAEVSEKRADTVAKQVAEGRPASTPQTPTGPAGYVQNLSGVIAGAVVSGPDGQAHGTVTIGQVVAQNLRIEGARQEPTVPSQPLEPKLRLVFGEVLADRLSFSPQPSLPARDAFIAAEMEKVREANPRDGIRMSAALLLEDGTWGEEHVSEPDADLDEYLAKCEAYLGELHEYRERESRTLRFTIALVNEGRVPADEVDVMLRFPPGVEVWAQDDESRSLKLPEEPHRYEVMAIPKGFLEYQQRNERLRANVTRLLAGPPNVSEASFRKTPAGTEVRASVRRIKHDRIHVDVALLRVMFSSRDAMESLEIGYRIFAVNVPDRAEGHLSVIVEKEGEATSTG